MATLLIRLAWTRLRTPSSSIAASAVAARHSRQHGLKFREGVQAPRGNAPPEGGAKSRSALDAPREDNMIDFISRRGWLLAGVAVIAGAGLGGSAIAQEKAAAADGSLLEEITVTARKRSENLQDTPVAITAVSAAAIERKGMTQITDLTASTPSLTLQGSAPLSGNSSAAVVFMRGIGQIDFTISTDPGVGVYVDGVYVARSAGAVLDLVDVERIEVLRGPQGTLFGRNTIGGAINVVSQAPASEFGGFVTGTIGSSERRQLQGAIDLPISDTFHTKFSGLYHRREGYVTRLQTGEKLGDDDSLSGRAQFEWRPNAVFEAELSIDATKKREAQAGVVPLAIDGTAFPLAFLENARIIGGSCAASPNTSLGCFGSAWETHDPYTTNATRPTRSDANTFGAGLTLNWALDRVNIKSITAYRTMDAAFSRDTDNTPFNFLYSDISQNQKQFSQELQFTGRAFNDRLKWLGGLYYFRETAFENYISAGDVNGAQGLNDTKNSNYAIFGEATYDLTPRLHLTAGLRYTDETKRFRTDAKIISGIRSPIGTRIVADTSWNQRTYKEASPRFTLAYDATDDLMAYVTYSKGFKSGGFNARYSSPVPNLISFDPEFATLYETGLKYQTPQRNLRLNLAAFRTDYSNVQTEYSVPGVLGALTGNAAAAKIDGVELEANWIPVAKLEIDGTVSWLDARYTESTPATIGVRAGNKLPLTPKWSASLSASYPFDLGAGGTLTPRVDASYRSAVYNTADNARIVHQDGYGVINGAVAWEPIKGDLTLTLGGRNLTDERYLLTATYSDAAGLAEGTYARPREWYLSVKKRF
jgi:iron complex outermembrane receptor protein